MTFATMSNLATVMLCVALIVQCRRMMRSLAAFKTADLAGTVNALTSATAEAQQVLADLRDELRNHAQPTLRGLADARQISDELNLMIGIADASADRLLRSGRGQERDLAA